MKHPPMTSASFLEATVTIAENASDKELLRQYEKTLSMYKMLHDADLLDQALLWNQAADINRTEILRRMSQRGI